MLFGDKSHSKGYCNAQSPHFMSLASSPRCWLPSKESHNLGYIRFMLREFGFLSLSSAPGTAPGTDWPWGRGGGGGGGGVGSKNIY